MRLQLQELLQSNASHLCMRYVAACPTNQITPICLCLCLLFIIHALFIRFLGFVPLGVNPHPAPMPDDKHPVNQLELLSHTVAVVALNAIRPPFLQRFCRDWFQLCGSRPIIRAEHIEATLLADHVDVLKTIRVLCVPCTRIGCEVIMLLLDFIPLGVDPHPAPMPDDKHPVNQLELLSHTVAVVALNAIRPPFLQRFCRDWFQLCGPRPIIGTEHIEAP
mmetsp:Transcript_10551/g.30995  ORF Transcript_10551/g.30995 Transcript_10551/m.30995 type:complete len:220 (+) Transcript_10551:1700-2359(+)